MLKGTDFGRAIEMAITRKIESGAARSKAEIARHFGVRPPSLSDWVKKGSISKERLPALWAYFADVVGPEHWGLTASEWPAGLAGAASHGAKDEQPAPASWPLKKSTPARIQALTPAQRRQVDDIVDAVLRGFEAEKQRRVE